MLFRALVPPMQAGNELAPAPPGGFHHLIDAVKFSVRGDAPVWVAGFHDVSEFSSGVFVLEISLGHFCLSKLGLRRQAVRVLTFGVGLFCGPARLRRSCARSLPLRSGRGA